MMISLSLELSRSRQQQAFACTRLHLQELGQGRVKVECPLAPNHVHYYVPLTVTLKLALASNLTLAIQVKRVFYLEKHIIVEAPCHVTARAGPRQGLLRADWLPPDTRGLSGHLVYQVAVTTMPRGAATTAATATWHFTRPIGAKPGRVKPDTVNNPDIAQPDRANTFKPAIVQPDITVKPDTEESDIVVKPAIDKLDISVKSAVEKPAKSMLQTPATSRTPATEMLLLSRAPSLLVDDLPLGERACVRVRARPDGASMGGPWGPWSHAACSWPAHITDLLSLLCFTRDLTSLACEWRVETILNLTFTLTYHSSAGSMPCAPNLPSSQFASCSLPPAATSDPVRAELRAETWDSTWNVATWGPALLRHAVQTHPPGHVTLHAGTSSGTLDVTWSSPDPRLTNHLRYEIGYTDAGGEAHWKVVPVEASTQLEMSGLSPGRGYWVRARTQPSSFLYRGSWSGWSRARLGTASPQHDMRSWSPYLAVFLFIVAVVVILFVTKTKLQRLKARLFPPVSAIDFPLNRLMSEFSDTVQGCAREVSPGFPEDTEVGACPIEVVSEVDSQRPLLHPREGVSGGGAGAGGGDDGDDGDDCSPSTRDPLASPKQTAIRRAATVGARKRRVDSGFSEGDTASDSGESDAARANLGESDSVVMDFSQPGLAELDYSGSCETYWLHAELFELACAKTDLSRTDLFNPNAAEFDLHPPNLAKPESSLSGLIESNGMNSETTQLELVESDTLNPYWEYKMNFESNSVRANEIDPSYDQADSGALESLQFDSTQLNEIESYLPESSLSEPNTGDPVLSGLDSKTQTSFPCGITSNASVPCPNPVTLTQNDGSVPPHTGQYQVPHNALQCTHRPQVWLVSDPEGYVIIPHHLLSNLGCLNPSSLSSLGDCALQCPQLNAGLAPSEGDMPTPGYVNMNLQPTT
uniref:Uncharacterized protein LOC116943141 isoform X1 n=1 Tax=Petromyzon marinus TaxID=7757 RepID=A0AAJ7WVG0_PETMA|nr:uncharacterized protein LOC116943141 isoform X1 [Petromyzon marinus]